MASSWQQRYNIKKQKTEKRGIEFSLTKEEFMRLHKLSDKCDYTGISFDEDGHTRSIERINDKKGYSIVNCCVVSQRVNLLKDCFVDKLKSCNVSPEDLTLIAKIKHTLETKTVEELTAKYRLGNEGTIVEDNKQIIESKKHQDLNISRAYMNFAKDKEDFELSFSDYKKLYVRKTCMITGKLFCEDNSLTQKHICKIDNSLSWTKNNTQIVCKMVNSVLNYQLFSKKELSKLVEKL